MTDAYSSKAGKIPRRKSTFKDFTPFGINEQAKTATVHERVSLQSLMDTGEFSRTELHRNLPTEIRNELDLHDISQKAQIYLKSDLSNKHEKGTSYLIAFENSLVALWKKEGYSFNLIQFNNEDIIEIGGEVDKTDQLDYLSIKTEQQSIKVWFHQEQTDQLLNFIEQWKANYGALEKTPQDNVKRHGVFGALMLHHISDEELNVSASGFKIVSNIVQDKLQESIDLYKSSSKSELATLAAQHFNYEQKMLLFCNLAELCFRNGSTHNNEIHDLKKLVVDICFPVDIFEEILHFSRVKNNLSLLD